MDANSNNINCYPGTGTNTVPATGNVWVMPVPVVCPCCGRCPSCGQYKVPDVVITYGTTTTVPAAW